MDKLPFCLNYIIVLFARLRELGDMAIFSLLVDVTTLFRSPRKTAFTILAAVMPAAEACPSATLTKLGEFLFS